MNKRILGGLAAAVMLTGGLAFSSGPAQATGPGDLTTDSGIYGSYKTSGAATHYYTLGGNVTFASNDELTWDGNGEEHLPCIGGMLHWISNGQNLTISHCEPGESTGPTEVTPEFTPPTCDVTGAPVLADEIEWTQDGDFWYASSADPELFTIVGETDFDSTRNEEECPPAARKPLVVREDIGNPVCDATTIKVKVTTITYTPKYDGKGWAQVASGPVVTEDFRELAASERSACSEPVTEVVEVISPTAPTQRPVPDVVFAFSPAQAPPAEVSALPPVAPAAGLPVTGIDGTGITAIIALLLTSLGGAALVAARRRDALI